MSLNFVFILTFIQLFYTLWSTLLTFLEQKLFFGCSIKFQFWNVQNTNFSGMKIDTILFLVWITSFPVKWWSKSCYKFLVLKCNKMGQKTSSMARKVSQSVSSMFGATGDDKDGANHSSALAITPFIYTKKGYLRIHIIYLHIIFDQFAYTGTKLLYSNIVYLQLFSADQGFMMKMETLPMNSMKKEI